ncbi:beta-ketoacyl synthase N-terminal-like domain-containing protein, partial [Ornithinibacillus scapharcae]|uniref:beta-ketoacyl synthase N-terminal-like domain-containing protein n=1 Tax=Ornithinibacillus scapharcae TaxID=1147159 RepID=UPI000492852F
IQHLVMKGIKERVYKFLGLEAKAVSVIKEPSRKNKVIISPGKGRRPQMKDWTIEQCLIWEIKDSIGQILRIPKEKLNVGENLADFGFDSISLGEFASVLSELYEIDVTPDLFFSYPTIERLSSYLLENYIEDMNKYYQEGEEVSFAKTENTSKLENPINSTQKKIRRNHYHRTSTSTKTDEPVAIIGVSGRFPEARSVDELWTLLSEGREVIREAPQSRLEWVEDDGENKRFGVLPGIAEFDPLFFGISPREANYMDPRQRLLLQESWKALEDAGYGSKSFENERIGMFVGIEDGDYRFMTKESSESGVTSNNNAVLAARLSYILNLDGPNMAINTACSSGLVAVHQACQSLRSGECDTAIVAGVNLMITPYSYNSMQKAGMLSEDGKCYAFDKRANGMVPGEAIGVVVLKRQSKAEADCNPIYATIMGSGINYDGKTNGITAPSGSSQSKLMKEVYQRFKINPQNMEYIVTHGTGTKLGDPIEINALVEAFKDFTEKSSYCALSSVKPNIGHTLAASGIVSLISLVMSLKHETIPASINCEEPNDYIHWENSPFYVNRSNQEWKDRDGKQRLSAVSSFGMSGTNAHVVVQSYAPKEKGNKLSTQHNEKPYYLLALSAKTAEALQQKIQDMQVFFQENLTMQPEELANISYTLMEGRQHFPYRFAVVVRNVAEAIRVFSGQTDSENEPNIFNGSVPKDFTVRAVINRTIEELIQECLEVEGHSRLYKENLYALAEYYCMGYEVSCKDLLSNIGLSKVNLPTYPFTREEYWLPDTEKLLHTTVMAGAIHPLLHQNTSDISSQRYSSWFSGKEIFTKANEEKGESVLVNAAHIEMARVASSLYMNGQQSSILLKDVYWNEPVTINDKSKQINIALYEQANDEIVWEIYSENGEGEEGYIVSSEGKAMIKDTTITKSLDLEKIKEQYPKGLYTPEMKKMKSDLTIDSLVEGLWIKDGLSNVENRELLIKFNQSHGPIQKGFKESVVLDPTILDSCLQAIHFCQDNRLNKVNISIVREAEFNAGTDNITWAILQVHHIENAEIDSLEMDISFYDEHGHVVSAIKGLVATSDSNDIALTVANESEIDSVQTNVQLNERSENSEIVHTTGKGRRVIMKGWTVEQCVLWELKNIVSQTLEIPEEKLDADENLADFGFDSISLAEFAINISDRYELTITPDVFYGYPTINRLSLYLLEEYTKEMENFYHVNEEKVRPEPQKVQHLSDKLNTHNNSTKIRRKREGKVSRSSQEKEPIAIIGLSGRFPEAENVEELWSILFEGKEAVREIPLDRLEWTGTHKTGNEKGIRKRAGLLSSIDEFDPLFFEISPRDAELMDPRQRLLLEETWKALEDAGYGAKSFENEKVGMFVGIEDGDYKQLVDNESSITSNHNAILAARLSYFLNLDGPNMAINTACSSSLVALHQACLSLRNGECDTAIVAGANIMVTSESYNGMYKAGMLSEDGACYAFDKRANGMVPGEAIAVVVLKRLSKAEADCNPIYASIVGSGINYDGKTNGITAPSRSSQSKLIKDVYDRFQINPQDMEYIVTHGTGTKLGDPVEINALAEAFKGHTEMKNYCALTSVKPNFGHTLAASGLVSLISLVMSLKHETIPASINCGQLNDYIQWEKSPFYVNRANREWKDRDGKKRLSAVSSFGMSGTNAHVVVQSYGVDGIQEEQSTNQVEKPYYLLALSAKTPESLQKKVHHLKGMFERNIDMAPSALANISYTLMEGRQHFRHRCAVVVSDREDAITVLGQAMSNGSVPNLFKATVSRDFVPQNAISQSIGELIEKSHRLENSLFEYQEILYALAEYYCIGYEISCEALFKNRLRKVSLPTYPFTKEKYWVPTEMRKTPIQVLKTDTIHPYVHENTSDLRGQRFSSVFTGTEDFLHSTNENNSYLPDLAHLEMIRVAALRSMSPSEGFTIVIQDVEWLEPVMIDQNTLVHSGLYPDGDGGLEWEIYAEAESSEEEPEVCSEGKIRAVEAKGIEAPHYELAVQFPVPLSMDDISKRLDFYMEEIRTVNTEQRSLLVCFKDRIEKENQGYKEREVLDVGLLEACLEAANVYLTNNIGSIRLFSMKKIEIPVQAGQPTFGVINMINTEQDSLLELDIVLYDQSENVVAAITGLQYQNQNIEEVVPPIKSKTEPKEQYELMTFEEKWEESALTLEEKQLHSVVVLVTDENRRQVIERNLKQLNPEITINFIGFGESYQKESTNRYTVHYGDKSGYVACLKDIMTSVGKVDAVLYLWPTEEEKWITDPTGILFLLQGIAEAKLKPDRVLLAGGYQDDLERSHLESWIGIERSTGLVMPGTKVSIIIANRNET